GRALVSAPAGGGDANKAGICCAFLPQAVNASAAFAASKGASPLTIWVTFLAWLAFDFINSLRCAIGSDWARRIVTPPKSTVAATMVRFISFLPLYCRAKSVDGRRSANEWPCLTARHTPGGEHPSRSVIPRT